MISGAFWFYRLFLSPALRVGFNINCRFEESCSHYAERVIKEQGLVKGIILGTKRILSCNQFSGSHHG